VKVRDRKSGRVSEVEAKEYTQAALDRLASELHRFAAKAEAQDRTVDEVDLLVDALISFFPDVDEVSATQDLVDRVGPFWSAHKTREALGLSSRQALSERTKNGSVLALRTSDNRLLYPLWQFRRTQGNSVEVLPALRPLISGLRGADSWSVALLMVIPADDLDGATPLEVARSNNDDPKCLVPFAERVAAEWA
jgi:hypothetical protein